MSAAPERIGVLGGTFDPPHVGHLWLATLMADALDLDRVLFMPAAQPPHKIAAELTAVAERTAMTELAIAGNPLFELTPVELERPGPSFTVDSMARLLELHPAPTRLLLLMAADSFAAVESWREPKRLLALVEWAVGPRAGVALGDPSSLRDRFGDAADRIHLVDGPTLDISSSEIRERVAAGRPISYLVPRAVEALITDRGLYRAAAAGRSTHTG